MTIIVLMYLHCVSIQPVWHSKVCTEVRRGEKAVLLCMSFFLISSRRNPAIDLCKYLLISTRALHYLMRKLTITG